MAERFVVLNPTSGRGRGQACRERLVQGLAALEGQSWEILETEKSGHAEELARQAAEQGAEIVAAAGGDGTLSDVLNGLMAAGGQAVLGVIPLGTGNDFARCIGVSASLDVALDILVNGQAKQIDIGKIVLETGERYFLNICGTGFDALVAERVHRGRSHPLTRRVKGMPAYLLAVLSELYGLRSARLRMELDGERVSERALLCAVANSTSYGGGMLVAPEASLEDGLFDICIIKQASRLEFLSAFPGVFSGKHVGHPKVQMRRAARIDIKANPALPILVDGDVLGTTPARFEILAGALRIMAPARKG